MTYDELMAMAREDDPLIDPDRPDSASVTPEGLLILGTAEGGYQSDMLIRIEPNGLRAWMRDPQDLPDVDAFHGKEWSEEAIFEDYEALRSWAYSW